MNYSTRETILAMQLSSRGLPQKITECIFSAVLILTAFIGNVLVCLAIKKNPKLRTVPNYYIASLALTDMLMSLLGMPLTFATLITDGWILGDVLCQYQGFIGTVLGIASLLIITLTAVNRYFRIVRVRQYPIYYTTKKAIFSIILAWCLALMVPVPYFAIGNRYRFHPGKAFCFFDLDTNNVIYNVSTIIGFAVLPFGVTALCYFKVFRTVRKHNITLAQIRTSRARKFGIDEVQLAKLLFVILLSFGACWTPFVIIDVIGAFKGQFYFPRYVYLLYTVFVELSSCINPIIYGAMNKEFRSEFRTIITACCCRISFPKMTSRAKYVFDSRSK